jgi:hypothetical protein
MSASPLPNLMVPFFVSPAVAPVLGAAPGFCPTPRAVSGAKQPGSDIAVSAVLEEIRSFRLSFQHADAKALLTRAWGLTLNAAAISLVVKLFGGPTSLKTAKEKVDWLVFVGAPVVPLSVLRSLCSSSGPRGALDVCAASVAFRSELAGTAPAASPPANPLCLWGPSSPVLVGGAAPPAAQPVGGAAPPPPAAQPFFVPPAAPVCPVLPPGSPVYPVLPPGLFTSALSPAVAVPSAGVFGFTPPAPSVTPPLFAPSAVPPFAPASGDKRNRSDQDSPSDGLSSPFARFISHLMSDLAKREYVNVLRFSTANRTAMGLKNTKRSMTSYCHQRAGVDRAR